jgi:hypothetical protein
MNNLANAAVVGTLVNRIRPILHGHDPGIQSAVLADLLAMWLAGHIGADRHGMREHLLAEHIKLVRDLIPPNEKMILTDLRKDEHSGNG